MPGVCLVPGPGRVDPEDPVKNPDLLAVAAGRVQAKDADLLQQDRLRQCLAERPDGVNAMVSHTGTLGLGLGPEPEPEPQPQP